MVATGATSEPSHEREGPAGSGAGDAAAASADSRGEALDVDAKAAVQPEAKADVRPSRPVRERVRRPSPCPTCDADLSRTDLDPERPTCPVCGQRLLAARVAGIGRRLAAAAIDVGVLSLTAGPLALLLDYLVRPPGSSFMVGTGLDAVVQMITADFGSLARRTAPLLTMAALYFGLFWALSGRTPGQRLLRVRVVDGQGRPPHPAVGALRSLVSLLAVLPVGLGAIWAAFDRENRALHDHVTGTWVVEESHP